MIDVVLASRLVLLREGMKRILALSPDICVVAEIKSIQELTSSNIHASKAVVVLAYVSEPGGGNPVERLKSACPLAQVIVVTPTPTLPQILSALRHGVRGLLSTSCAAGNLPDAIRAVSAGKIYIQENVYRLFAESLHKLDKAPAHNTLTGRELEILMKLTAGLRVTEIASELGISVKTVSTHKGRLMEKLGITSFSQLIQYAMANDLYDMSGTFTQAQP